MSGLPSMTFSASELVAKPGKIRVDFSVPAGSAPHNFVIPRVNGAFTRIVSAGNSQSVTFTVTEPGSYQIVCTIHANMTATLKIT
ncbi:cupredoxin domain-containing protein [Frankia sp. AgPm24]|uniref:cupredoxin domain-containing protein n=1 Tax=Frankia sp. AgPm24 TaxID=631128 RepID=UPI0027E32A4C|nr:cupredoxin domain-containing protein [Frankia sp. AgPm24]